MTTSRAIIPPRSEIGDDTPLRLDVAAAVAFPDGSMTAAGLLLEARRRHLVISRVAGKNYTTRRRIQAMLELCRQEGEARDSGKDRRADPPMESIAPDTGSLSTDDIKKAHDAALTIVEGLSEPSPSTSRASKSKARRKGNVIPLQSRSPT